MVDCKYIPTAKKTVYRDCVVILTESYLYSRNV